MKTSKHTFTPEQITEMVRLYNEEKMGTPAIGKIFNVNKGIINRAIKKAGVAMDQPGRRDIGGKAAADKRYYTKNKEDIQEYYKVWAKDKREDLREYHTEWRNENRVELRKRQNAYEQNRLAEDPAYKLKKRTRTAVYTCLKERNINKQCGTFKLLGYTLEELMKHLESKFTEGMSWDNYGLWHVDHIIPMSKFTFTSTDDHEFKLCWCLDNMQPLWQFDNLSKGPRS